jgi:hypothetical protein
MPATKVQRSAPRKAAPARKRPATSKGHAPAKTIERSTELSQDVLKSLESGERAVIEAVQKFVDTVDKTLPAIGDRPSRRQEIVDAAMEMADRLVHTQYEFIRRVVKSAGDTLSGGPEVKK